MAFGEVGVKARIRSLLNYKRPAFWVIAVSLILCIAAAVALFTVRPESDELYIGGGIEVTKESTELDGISARVISADLNAKRPYIEVEWKSERDEHISFTEAGITIFFRAVQLENVSISIASIWRYPI